tara:strand:+ start:1748 stop:2227 length:480 start_codon:yes stop_codon:yes gene_type:complete
MADPTVSNEWSSGEVLTAADLNENFADIIAFFAAGSITKSHISDKYTTTCITMNLDTLAAGATVIMELETDVDLTPTKLSLHADTFVGGTTLELVLKKDGVQISTGTLDVTNDTLDKVTSFTGGNIDGGDTLEFEFEATGGTSVSNITACLWCKAELRA